MDVLEIHFLLHFGSLAGPSQTEERQQEYSWGPQSAYYLVFLSLEVL